MKSIFILTLVIFVASEGYAQKRRPKIMPPPPALPPPPKPIPAVDEKMNTDPLEERVMTFWTDTLYTATDSSFQMEQSYFSPSGLGKARLAKAVYPYPKGYIKDSLIQNGNRVLALTKEMYFQDGAYSYNKKPLQKSDKLIFVDDKTKRRTVFSIQWKGEGTNRTIEGLVEEPGKTIWKPGEPPAFAPVGY